MHELSIRGLSISHHARKKKKKETNSRHRTCKFKSTL